MWHPCPDELVTLINNRKLIYMLMFKKKSEHNNYLRVLAFNYTEVFIVVN